MEIDEDLVLNHMEVIKQTITDAPYDTLTVNYEDEKLRRF